MNLEEFLIGGQIFRCAGLVDHITKAGQKIQLMSFNSFCADCGSPFVSKTRIPVDMKMMSRRCDRCKKPGKPVRKVVQP